MKILSVPPAETGEPPAGTVAQGLRIGVPYAMASFLLGLSFGVLARPVLGAVATIVMSVIVFAGSAQFAALAVLSAGGGALPAIIAGSLLNLRFIPMGIAIAASLDHRAVARAMRGQALVDASWALANRGDGSFDIPLLLGSTLAQYPAWVLGTIAGVLAGGVITDPGALGLDAIFPAFFLALLAIELQRPGARLVCALAAVITFALIGVAPPGVPIIAASLAALAGLRR